ncbi:cerebellin-1-like [Engraulis encrasicolus]|uniref:cerebellin-1-like n=1 Tax=Engraulis encrasicolus TaxID=184585 RepID=UPI002FD44F07
MCGAQPVNSQTDAQEELLSLGEELRELLSATRMELQDTKADMKSEVENLKRENAALLSRLAAAESQVETLERGVREAPKVAFAAALTNKGYIQADDSLNMNLVFEKVLTNVGQAYSTETGFFTAPVKGVYFFRFTVRDDMARRWMDVRLHKNGQQVVQLEESGDDGFATYLSSGLALDMEEGDTVNMVLPAKRRVYDDYANHSTFSGFLVFPL